MNAPVKRFILFAREPVRGRVKTRLAREIGPAAAASLYEAFLSDLAASLTAPGRWDAVLAHAEYDAGPTLLATFRPPWDLVPQGEGSLGERLTRAVVRARLRRAARRSRGRKRRPDAHRRGSLRGIRRPRGRERRRVRAGSRRRVLARRHAWERRTGRRLPGRGEMVLGTRPRRLQEVRRGEGLPRAPALDRARRR